MWVLLMANGSAKPRRPEEENVELLRRRIEEGESFLESHRWSDTVDTDASEIRSEGRVLLAKLRDDSKDNVPGLWITWVGDITDTDFIMHE